MPAGKRSTSRAASLDKQTGRAIMEGDSSPIPNRATKRAAKTAAPAVPTMPAAADPVFLKTRHFIRQFAVLDWWQLNVAAMWVMGTWTFSPAAPAMPYTYPYLYITGKSNSGKSTLGQQAFGAICRNAESIAGATGASLFRMLGEYDPETGEVENHYPTLLVDEVDATYNGAKDESQRQVFNIGYRQGTTVPRAAGKTTIRFPVYGPKVLMGIDNGHLPETVVNRSIRIEMKPAAPADRDTLVPFFPWNVDQPAAELKEDLAQWAKDNAMVLRDYDPKQGKLQNRQWEIARSLVQLGKAAGVEQVMRDSIENLFARATEKPEAKVVLYKAIWDMFEQAEQQAGELKPRALTSRYIKAGLDAAGITVRANSMTGMSYQFKEDGLGEVDFLQIRDPKHPCYIAGKSSARGYYRHYFDDAFVKFLTAEDEDA